MCFVDTPIYDNYCDHKDRLTIDQLLTCINFNIITSDEENVIKIPFPKGSILTIDVTGPGIISNPDGYHNQYNSYHVVNDVLEVHKMTYNDLDILYSVSNNGKTQIFLPQMKAPHTTKIPVNTPIYVEFFSYHVVADQEYLTNRRQIQNALLTTNSRSKSAISFIGSISKSIAVYVDRRNQKVSEKLDLHFISNREFGEILTKREWKIRDICNSNTLDAVITSDQFEDSIIINRGVMQKSDYITEIPNAFKFKRKGKYKFKCISPVAIFWRYLTLE